MFLTVLAKFVSLAPMHIKNTSKFYIRTNNKYGHILTHKVLSSSFKTHSIRLINTRTELCSIWILPYCMIRAW